MTIHSRSLRSLCAPVLAAAALLSTAAAAADIQQATGCRKPRYPEEAMQRWEAGISVVAVLVRADGTPLRSVVADSSGFEPLDRAVLEMVMKCRWTALADGDGTGERWWRYMFIWRIDGDNDLLGAKKTAAIAASKGDVAARYRLSRLLEMVPKDERDRRNSVTMLRSAAELGYAPAQYGLGLHYERGDGMAADIEEALRWYRKAADQGNLFAIQRLEKGFLPE